MRELDERGVKIAMLEEGEGAPGSVGALGGGGGGGVETQIKNHSSNSEIISSKQIR